MTGSPLIDRLRAAMTMLRRSGDVTPQAVKVVETILTEEEYR